MPRTAPLALVLLLALAASSKAGGGFVVIANSTEQPVRFTVRHSGESAAFAVGPGESQRVPAGRHPILLCESGGKPVRFRLMPYAAYLFLPAEGGPTLQGIELAAPLPEPDDLPDAPPEADRPYALTVRVLLDDADPRRKETRERAIRERVAETSKLLERECGVVLKVGETASWTSDPKAGSAAALLADLARSAKADDRSLVIGFTSRRLAPATPGRCSLGTAHFPYRSHILLCESLFPSEADRVEVLTHEVMHALGAVHSPDPASVMRPTPGDGKARSRSFRVGLDPLNALAVGIWVEELRRGEIEDWKDLRPPARARLAAVYRTIAHALPDDPSVREFAAALGRAMPEAKGEAKLEGKINPLSAKQQAVRKVVRAVTIRATDLNRKPEGERLTGDALTAEYVRTAAAVAATEEEALQPVALAVGLGLALDDSTTLRANPLTAAFCRPVESDEERRERLAVLGSPTVRGRRDLCQHFVVSAALTELLGADAATAAGLLKERLDLARTSGYSFTDLAADLAGVAFAKKLKADPRAVARMSVLFEVEEYAPDVTGWPEGLTKEKFKSDYGSETDPRFIKQLDEIRKRVNDLPGYR